MRTEGEKERRRREGKDDGFYLFRFGRAATARKQINISVNWPYPNTSDWYILPRDFRCFFFPLSFFFFFRLLVVRFYIYFWRDTFTAENLAPRDDTRTLCSTSLIFVALCDDQKRILISLTMEPGKMHFSASLFSSMHTNRLISQRYPARVSLGSWTFRRPILLYIIRIRFLPVTSLIHFSRVHSEVLINAFSLSYSSSSSSSLWRRPKRRGKKEEGRKGRKVESNK